MSDQRVTKVDRYLSALPSGRSPNAQEIVTALDRPLTDWPSGSSLDAFDRELLAAGWSQDEINASREAHRQAIRAALEADPFIKLARMYQDLSPYDHHHQVLTTGFDFMAQLEHLVQDYWS